MDSATLAAISAALDSVYTQFGVAASWLAGGSSTAVNCTVIPDTAKSNIDIYLQADGRVKTCSVRKSEISAVKVGKDIVTISSESWRVADVLAEDELETHVILSKEL
jgi:hypothetical protein